MLIMSFKEFTVLDEDGVEVLDEDYFSEINGGTVMQIRTEIKQKLVTREKNNNDENQEIKNTTNLPRLQIFLPGGAMKHGDLVKVMGKVSNMSIGIIILLFISGF